MPNYCTYDLRAEGKKKDLLTLTDWLAADYHYNEDPPVIVKKETGIVPTEHHIGYRVFDFYPLEYGENFENARPNEVVKMSGYGDVAWSVETTMFDGPHTYTEDAKDLPNRKSITLPDACRMLHVRAEIYSLEEGVGFVEHYLVSEDGEVVVSDCFDCAAFWIPEQNTLQEVAEEHDLVLKDDKLYSAGSEKKLIITKEQFEAVKDAGEDIFYVCDIADPEYPCYIQQDWSIEIQSI